MPRRRNTILGVTASGHQRADAIAGADRNDTFADADDQTGDLQARNVRRAGWRRIVALALHHVGPIHPGGNDSNEDLARPWLRRRALSQAQNLGSARRQYLDGCHRRWNVREHRIHFSPIRQHTLARNCIVVGGS